MFHDALVPFAERRIIFMDIELTIEYEIFEDEGIRVLSVVDKKKDEVLNMFHDDEAEKIYGILVNME